MRCVMCMCGRQSITHTHTHTHTHIHTPHTCTHAHIQAKDPVASAEQYRGRAYDAYLSRITSMDK